ncbi:MAG: MT-A70 family methyltransferase [Hyphomicrobiaceae bacterium]
MTACDDLLSFADGQRFATILADPPWRFQNRTGKMAPEHKRLSRYSTLTLTEIGALPIPDLTASTAHLYLWVPNALLMEGMRVMEAWGFTYKTNIVWHKIRKDGGPDGRGVGFYFRNTTELVLFGVRGKNARTLAPGRRQVNIIKTQKREHSRKPDELYEIIEACSAGPFLELFARGPRNGWRCWGDQAEDYQPTWATYANHSGRTRAPASQEKPKSVPQLDLALVEPSAMRESKKSSKGKKPTPAKSHEKAKHINGSKVALPPRKTKRTRKGAEPARLLL